MVGMSRFSLDTSNLAEQVFLSTRHPTPYHRSSDKAWLDELLQRDPLLIEALGARNGACLHESSARSCRISMNILIDRRPDLLVDFLWKIHTQTEHDFTKILDGKSLDIKAAVDAMVVHQQQFPNIATFSAVRLRELIDLAIHSTDPAPWCYAIQTLQWKIDKLSKKRVGEWITSIFHDAAGKDQEQAIHNVGVLLDTLDFIGLHCKQPEYEMLVAATKEYIRDQDRHGLISVLVARGHDWQRELDRPEIPKGIRLALAQHPAIKKQRLLMQLNETAPENSPRPKL